MALRLSQTRLLPLLALLTLTACTQPHRVLEDANMSEQIASAADTDPLTRLGLRASTGAAAGYVEDKGCGICHADKFDSYQGVGMAQSLRRPQHAPRIEDFDLPEFLHAPSQEHYTMRWRDGKLIFQRWQLDARGGRINAIEQRVDWILGSGHRARVYLYGATSGELFQLPIAWYSQERAWGMAPGYDRADHDGITRRVRRECLFCHNAYPQTPTGSDAHWAPQTFPADLPEGTGCQRCHGPGAEHIRTALKGGTTAAIHAAIVNPRRLPPDRRDAVCFQCHLLPAVAMIGPRRFERGDYSFRPGERLDDYLLHLDIDEPGRAAEDRFEINHHAYRMTQSLCYQKGGITCIDCHDPHQPLRQDTRLAKVSATCAGCHRPHGPQAAPAGSGAPIAAGDCVGCHMLRRRTQDVVHVTMTDHRIQRRPQWVAPLAPLRERDPEISAVRFFSPQHAPTGAIGNAYRATAVLRASAGDGVALSRLDAALKASTPTTPTPWLDLTAAQLFQRRFADAAHTLEMLLPVHAANNPQLIAWRGTARIGLGRTLVGLDDLRQAAMSAPDTPEFQFNLGLIQHRTGDYQAAVAALTRAVTLRPNLVSAWLTRGATFAALGRRDEAIADYRQALQINPRETRAYIGLVVLLRETGRNAEADRYLTHGLRIAGDPARLRGQLRAQ